MKRKAGYDYYLKGEDSGMEHVVDVHRKVFVVAHRKNQVAVDQIQSPGSIINISAYLSSRHEMKLGHRHLSTCGL